MSKNRALAVDLTALPVDFRLLGESWRLALMAENKSGRAIQPRRRKSVHQLERSDVDPRVGVEPHITAARRSFSR
jgi:hypothetical protein